jgi:hypothetical protein
MTTTFGDVVTTQVHNILTRRYEMRIDRADRHILISNDLAQQVFDTGNHNMWGVVTLAPLQLFLVINGRNRQVKYRLDTYRDTENVWEAELVDDHRE